jgi:hypothetical protein
VMLFSKRIFTQYSLRNRRSLQICTWDSKIGYFICLKFLPLLRLSS